MTTAVKLDTDDIKKIIASYFNVDEIKIIKAQYSYFVEGVDQKDFKSGSEQ